MKLIVREFSINSMGEKQIWFSHECDDVDEAIEAFKTCLEKSKHTNANDLVEIVANHQEKIIKNDFDYLSED